MSAPHDRRDHRRARAARAFREAGNPAARLVDAGEFARGGFSSIRKVYDPKLLRHVALKVLDPKRGTEHSDSVAGLLEEAQITGQLDHPNIVPIYDLGGDSEGRPSFSMKLVEGRTFTSIIDEKLDDLGARDLEELVTIILRVCDAISFAHGRGVIHCDLKPDNVMIGSHGQVYVMDWGCALLVGKRREGESRSVVLERDADAAALDSPTIVGTAAYMPPEQAQGRIEDIDERTDVYALGALLYRMLTGNPPHRAKTTAESLRLAQCGIVRPPQEVEGVGRLPPGLCAITMKALDPDPARRHASVAALRSELERFLRGGGWFTRVTFPAGATIVREGDSGDCAYIIVSGTCEARKGEGARQVSMRVMGRGEVVGEMAVLAACPRTSTVVALEEVTALVVTRESFELELGTDSWMGVFVRALAERFRELDSRIT